MRDKGRRECGNNKLTLAKDLGSVEGGINDRTGGAIGEGAGIEEKGNKGLPGGSGIFLPIGK